MKTAAAYIRVSTDDQIEFSPDSQLKAIRKYAKEHDMILPKEYVFVDEGISGRTAAKRPEFNRMIATAKTTPKPFDTIVLWKFSRFARNRQDSIVYKSMLRKQCGIDVVSVSEQLGEDNTSILIEALIEAMDEYYSLNLAEEVRRGMNEKFSRGGVVSQPPFGYKMRDGIFAPDEQNAPIVRMMFTDYLGGMKVRQIAEKLNRLGITTGKGGLWENRTVEYVLSNPTYIGKMRRSADPTDRRDRFHDNAVLVDGKHEPLIAPDIFAAAQERRAAVKQLYAPRARQAPAEYMLKGLVRCDSCGATLVSTHHRDYLQCHNYNRGTCKVSHCIKLTSLNTIVLDKIRADLEGDEMPIELGAGAQGKPEEQTDTAEQLIAREQKKLERVKEAYEAGIDTLDEYRVNKAKIQARIEEIKAEYEPPAPEIGGSERNEIVRGRVRAGLHTLESPDISETTKNETLRAIVERIIFIKPKRVVEISYKGVF